MSSRERVPGVADVGTFCGPAATSSRSRVRILVRLEPDLVDDEGETDLSLEQAEELLVALRAAIDRARPEEKECDCTGGERLFEGGHRQACPLYPVGGRASRE